MKDYFAVAFVVMSLVAGIAVTSAQQSTDDERRAGITVMRAINTAENAVRQTTGKFVPLGDLLDHRFMAKVRPAIVVSGDMISYQGQQLRLALSADASQYQVMVVPAATCGTAVFSDERGLIYTGKVLDC